MPICSMCGREFDLSDARRIIGRRYGAGEYNDNYPDGDVCEDCAIEELGTAYNAGAEVLYYARKSGWDNED